MKAAQNCIKVQQLSIRIKLHSTTVVCRICISLQDTEHCMLLIIVALYTYLYR